MGFEALGYYCRWISHEETGQALRIKIRRFLSKGCGVTVSCLPDFCQPYRIVCCSAIEAYFEGERKHGAVRGWLDVLAGYRRRFGKWMMGAVAGMGQGLLATVGARFGRPPPPGGDLPDKFWTQIIVACGGVGPATRRLLREFEVTLFGRYRCHSSKRGSSGKIQRWD